MQTVHERFKDRIRLVYMMMYCGGQSGRACDTKVRNPGYLWVNEGTLTVRMGSRKKYDQISFKEDFAGVLWVQFIWNCTQGPSLETCDHIAYEIECKVKVIFQIIWGKNRILLILKSRLNPCTDAILPFYLCSSKQPKEQVFFFSLLKWNLETLVSNVKPQMITGHAFKLKLPSLLLNIAPFWK